MPEPTPFHSRTSSACQSFDWRDWSGYLAASSYLPTHESEYFAIRNSAGLIDVSPLFKYDIIGPEALGVVNRIMTRDFNKCAVGRVMYSAWCDEEGKLIQDGNVVRLADDHFRVSSADPSLRWFEDCAYGMSAGVVDMSSDLAAVAIQGPRSRRILEAALRGSGVEGLGYFRAVPGRVNGFPVIVTRTGFTGDLGYELWVFAEYAEALWDRLVEAGQAHDLLPAGMLALDMTRIEAGLPLIEVDFVSAPHATIEARKSSPYEVGLGWTVKLGKGDFVGRAALAREHEQGSRWAFVGVEVGWEELERLWGAVGLRPQVVGQPASRLPAPIYLDGQQIGQATSHTYSPLLKKYLALASVASAHSETGTDLEIELTVEFRRVRANARIVPTPFFEPKRKRA